MAAVHRGEAADGAAAGGGAAAAALDEAMARAAQDEENVWAAQASFGGTVPASPVSLPVVRAEVAGVAAPPMPADGCETSCVVSSVGLLAAYVTTVAVGVLVTLAFLPAGVFVLSLGPPICLVAYFIFCIYRVETHPRQAFFSALEAIGLILPLLMVVLPLSLAISAATGLDREDAQSAEGISVKSVLAAAVMAFGLAAIPEELLKFLTVWHLAGVTPDPRGLIVYAMCGAAGFAAVENFLYVVISQSLSTGIIRASLSVPGHIATGAIIGGRLARDVFLDTETSGVFASSQAARALPRCPSCAYLFRVLWVPILLHGSFNFCLFLTAQLAGRSGIALGLIALVILGDLAGIAVARSHARRFSQFPREDARARVASGAAPAPALRCCLGVCGSCCRGAPAEVTVGPPTMVGQAVGQLPAQQYPPPVSSYATYPVGQQPVAAHSTAQRVVVIGVPLQ